MLPCGCNIEESKRLEHDLSFHGPEGTLWHEWLRCKCGKVYELDHYCTKDDPRTEFSLVNEDDGSVTKLNWISRTYKFEVGDINE